MNIIIKLVDYEFIYFYIIWNIENNQFLIYKFHVFANYYYYFLLR